MIKEKLIPKKKKITVHIPENYINREIEVKVSLSKRKKRKEKTKHKVNNYIPSFVLMNSKPVGTDFPSNYRGLYKVIKGDLEKEIENLRNEWERDI